MTAEEQTELIALADRLPDESRCWLLAALRSLVGQTRRRALVFSDGPLSHEEAAMMLADIEEACGQADPDGW